MKLESIGIDTSNDGESEAFWIINEDLTSTKNKHLILFKLEGPVYKHTVERPSQKGGKDSVERPHYPRKYNI